ncbi:hypothetical protein OWM54_27260 [Myxococcus sp. MISCRS1]|uniref:hypothetical protein n=1 Tax=Myxococcus sp. MISCRS1 TaxID=2996786 RepID=UPI00226D8FE9|nr:hypothetical protein [Myxococcus sp. MISCRS1]MCY1000855.1 hypothetical protein [Myxococcus sp. MISCRS1]
MAQFFPGLSRCILCKQVIDDAPVMFPAFIPKGHSLWGYQDASFHAPCFDGWEHRARFLLIYDDALRLEASMPKDLSLEENENLFAERSRRWRERILREDLTPPTQ